MADTTVSHQTLLIQCAEGKTDGLKLLYEYEAPRLLALGFSLLQRPTDAEELVRESFRLIWRHADAYDPALGSARAWIYSVFRFRALQRLKKSTTRSPFIKKVKPQLIISSSAPTDLLPFQRLDEQARSMLAIAYLHAYSFAEIAKACQSNIELTQQHINNALLQLTQSFKGWKSDSKEDLTLLGMYCLGLLHEPHQITSAQTLLSNNPHAAHDLLLWEDTLSALTHTLKISALPPELLTRIYNDLGLDPPSFSPTPAPASIPAQVQSRFNDKYTKPIDTPKTETPKHSKSPQPQLSKGKKKYWMIGGLFALVLSGITVWAFMPKAPIIQRIEMSPRAGAVLLAPGQSSTPGWIVTVDPEGNVLLTPQVQTEVETEKAVQLWTQSPQSLKTRSLGILNPNEPVTVPNDLIGEVHTGQIFEMTLEPEKGSIEPSGPVLFIGRVVNFGEP